MEGPVPEDLAVVVDAGGTVTVWSSGARRLLGHEAAEVVGRPAADLLAADLPESARRHIAQGRRWATEVALRHRDGDRVVVRLKGTPLADGDGARPWLITPDPVVLRLIRDSSLICEVSDGSSTAPHLRRARVFDEGGRGLLLVAQMAERWGSRQTATGKTIWAELGLPD